MDGLEIPDAHIAAEGFGGLSDDQLADIALAEMRLAPSASTSTTRKRSGVIG